MYSMAFGTSLAAGAAGSLTDSPDHRLKDLNFCRPGLTIRQTKHVLGAPNVEGAPQKFGFPCMKEQFKTMTSAFVRGSSAIVMTYFFVSVISFNIDLNTRVMHKMDHEEWFGFSVALHMDGDEKSWLIVGAPKAKTDQPGVIRGGAVYRCAPDTPNACQVIPFDTEGNKLIKVQGQDVATDNKTEQWFGATVVSSGKYGTIVLPRVTDYPTGGVIVVFRCPDHLYPTKNEACAPRYVHHSQNLKRREPVGTCYVSRFNSRGFTEYAPCRTIDITTKAKLQFVYISDSWGYHRQGSCQAGISAAITSDGRRLFIGAVGSWYWQGQVFSQNLLDKSDRRATTEDSTLFDTSYLGFSSAVGEFTGDDQEDVAVGRPRGGNLSGQVLLFSSTLQSVFNITGEQIGSYFGYSVTASDVNGDQLDDVIIGAPLYNNYSTKDSSYESGRIYVCYQSRKHKFKDCDTIDGMTNKGRFGLALASLGDLNKDGFGDLCVGAPYGGKNEHGSIYIFLGGSRNINTEPSQVIHAEDIDPQISTFGFSLSGGLDMDGNKYPDLLVGGYNSDVAVFFRARPIVSLYVSFDEPNSLQLDTMKCTPSDVTVSVRCLHINLCFTYDGIGLENTLEIEFELILDAENRNNPRLFFITNESSKLTETNIIGRKEMVCKLFFVFPAKEIEDKLTPITVVATPKLIHSSESSNLLLPILDATLPKSESVKIYIQNECGPDQVCIPEIVMNVSTNDHRYVIGQKEKLTLNFSIMNEGEDAYQTTFYLMMSDHVYFVKVQPINAKEYPVNCDGPQPGQPNILVCHVGNPFPANQLVQFNVLVSAKMFTSGVSTFEFVATINSTNPELPTTVANNHYSVEIPVYVASQLQSYGLSNPWTISYNSTHYEEIEEKQSVTDIGPEIIHTYALSNTGPSPIVRVNVTILWPIETLSRSPLLYLVAQPFVFGNGSCSKVSYVNDMNVKVDELALKQKILKILKSRTEYFEQDERKNISKNEEVAYIRRVRNAFSNELMQDTISCGGALCIQINCTLNNLDSDTSFISIPGRLWASTVRELQLNKLSVTSKMIARIAQLPIGVDVSNYPPEINIITTEIDARDIEIQRTEIPWWIIVVAVCIGLLILITIMFFLWKTGFFKRKRPQDLDNTSINASLGYHSPRGDEAFL
ncbi:Integrin alpha-PS2 [Nymphon striatum]|nr:Integrin alpha-PS2 [Nymphon striatum]